MKRTNSLILFILLCLILFQSQQVEANITEGKKYQYFWTTNSNFTYDGISLYTSRESNYFLEIMYIEEDKIGVKVGSANRIRFDEYLLVSKDHMTFYYPDIYGQPYFLNKDDFNTFYTNWIDEYSENLYMIDFSAENRVFTYSEKNPNYNNSIGYNSTDPGPSEDIYDEGEFTKKIRCEYTRDGVLSYLKDERVFKGAISEDYFLEVLTLTDVKLGSNSSILLISCSLVIVSSIYLIIRRRRVDL